MRLNKKNYLIITCLLCLFSGVIYIYSLSLQYKYENSGIENNPLINSKYTIVGLEEFYDKVNNVTLEPLVYSLYYDSEIVYILGNRGVYIINIDTDRILLFQNPSPLFESEKSNSDLQKIYGEKMGVISVFNDEEKYAVRKLITPELYWIGSNSDNKRKWFDYVIKETE